LLHTSFGGDVFEFIQRMGRKAGELYLTIYIKVKKEEGNHFLILEN
jgi:hypothetical protein